MGLTPHTSTNKGKRVKVVLKNGDWFVDKFKEATHKYSVFETKGRILKSDIKAFSIFKGIFHH